MKRVQVRKMLVYQDYVEIPNHDQILILSTVQVMNFQRALNIIKVGLVNILNTNAVSTPTDSPPTSRNRITFQDPLSPR